MQQIRGTVWTISTHEVLSLKKKTILIHCFRSGWAQTTCEIRIKAMYLDDFYVALNEGNVRNLETIVAVKLSYKS